MGLLGDIVGRGAGYVSGLLAPQVMRVGDTTYGPSMSRVTRTPIRFAPSDNKGEYDPATKGITIDPTKTTNVPATVRHESIHALLDSVPGAAAMATQSAGFPDIAKNITGGMGNAPDEVPAYLGSYPTSQFLNMSEQARQAFLNDFRQRLAAAAPGQAQQFDRLQQ